MDERKETLLGLLLMGAASLVILFAAWLALPVPVVKDSLQTEILSVHVHGEGGYRSWYPQDMVQRQTARAITDHMAGCRERHTLRRAGKVLEGAPEIQVCFRTEDTYRVVFLGNPQAPGTAVGWTVDQDREGLAARVRDPEALADYILEQIGEELFSDA